MCLRVILQAENVRHRDGSSTMVIINVLEVIIKQLYIT